MTLKSDIAALQHGIDNTDPAATWFPADTATVRRLLAELAAREADHAKEDPTHVAEVAKLTGLIVSLRQERDAVQARLNLVAGERDSLRLAAQEFHRKADGKDAQKA